jgi:hypothetical protein
VQAAAVCVQAAADTWDWLWACREREMEGAARLSDRPTLHIANSSLRASRATVAPPTPYPAQVAQPLLDVAPIDEQLQLLEATPFAPRLLRRPLEPHDTA